jgi:hypothetical protein
VKVNAKEINMPTVDLSNKLDREAIETSILDDIDAYCVGKYGNEHRNHLGASEMGKPCSRMLWYKFRWVKKPDFDGRMLRLFNVGHSAEPRFIDYLRGIGFEVKEFADDGKQFRISGVNGHYGGSLDGMCKAPAKYNLDTELVFLNEFKTNGTGAAYNKVATEHLSKAKPEHFDQMSQYGYHYKFKYGLYLIENKNDSSLTVKIVELDWNRGAELGRRAEEIINATEPPARISDNPAFRECSWCDMKGICHGGDLPEKNCRSCLMCIPIADAAWHCNRFDKVIPSDFIAKGCQEWTPI